MLIFAPLIVFWMKKPRLFPDGAVVAKWKDHVAGDSNMVKGRRSLHPHPKGSVDFLDQPHRID